MTRRRGPRQRFGNYVTKHGLTGSTEHNIWCGIRKRCNNPRDRLYPYYGARGIKVCARWDDFAAFLADMGPRPSSQHSIERRDNDKGYEPINCCWATRIQQMRNKRDNRLLTHLGRTQCVTAWAAELGLSVHTIRKRLYGGASAGAALRRPRPYRRSVDA